MQVVDWPTWLEQYIPYYEKQKHLDRYYDNPPASVLVVDPVDRNRRVGLRGFAWSTWEAMDTTYELYATEPNPCSWTQTHINVGIGCSGVPMKPCYLC